MTNINNTNLIINTYKSYNPNNINKVNNNQKVLYIF